MAPVVQASLAASDKGRWISAALSSSQDDEVYFFMGNYYVLINYTPANPKDDFVAGGPGFIDAGFPSLADGIFAELGIDCAFRRHRLNEAFIFCGNLCALWDFAPRTNNDKLLKGPVTIGKMFPFLKGTNFDTDIDAAFESSMTGEAFLFKGNQCASINYNSGQLLFIKDITQVFQSLRGTIFDSGVEAAFASHIQNEAYLFKGDSYLRFKFGSGNTDDSSITGVQKILPNWPSLKGILPRKTQ